MKLNSNIINIMGAKLGDSKLLNFMLDINDKFSIKKIDGDVYIIFSLNGVELLFINNILCSIFFYINKKGFVKSTYSIFEDIPIPESIDDVLINNNLNQIEKGEGGETIIGRVNPWVKFKVDENLYIHIEYTEKEHDIVLITISNNII